jgi:hypothetical protein
MIEQHSGGVLVAEHCRLVQRGVAVLVEEVRRGAVRHEPAGVGKVAAKRRLVQRRLAVARLRVEVGAVVLEQVEQVLGLVARSDTDGVVERRRALVVADIRIVALAHEEHRGGDALLRGGVVQRRPAGAIGAVHQRVVDLDEHAADLVEAVGGGEHERRLLARVDRADELLAGGVVDALLEEKVHRFEIASLRGAKHHIAVGRVGEIAESAALALRVERAGGRRGAAGRIGAWGVSGRTGVRGLVAIRWRIVVLLDGARTRLAATEHRANAIRTTLESANSVLKRSDFGRQWQWRRRGRRLITAMNRRTSGLGLKTRGRRSSTNIIATGIDTTITTTTTTIVVVVVLIMHEIRRRHARGELRLGRERHGGRRWHRRRRRRRLVGRRCGRRRLAARGTERRGVDVVAVGGECRGAVLQL